MRKLALMAFAVIVLSLSGCMSFEGIPTGERQYSPRPEGHRVILYNDVSECSHAYEVIGRISGSAPENYGLSDVAEAMREEARKLGGDAVVFNIHERAAGSTSGGAAVGGYSGGNAYAVGVGSSTIEYEKAGNALVLRFTD